MEDHAVVADLKNISTGMGFLRNPLLSALDSLALELRMLPALVLELLLLLLRLNLRCRAIDMISE